MLFNKLLNEQLPGAVTHESIRAYLHFDSQTICPSGAKSDMGDILAFATTQAHNAFTNPEIGASIQRLNDHNSNLSIRERMIVKRLMTSYRRAQALSPEFVAHEEKVISDANMAWAKAREKNDSSIFMPHFKSVLKTMKDKAELYGTGDGSSYSALMAGYEPGTSPDHVNDLVQQVIKWAVPFVKSIKESNITLSDAPLHGHFDIGNQKLLADSLSKSIGYNHDRGHIALTTHPFMSTVNRHDHRITMRMNPEFLASCIFAVMHETGHALYAQNVDPIMDKINTSGLLYSLGLHESSSRLWENMVGRSLPFLEHIYPTIQALFPQLNSVSLEEFYRATNVVQPSYIRVEADEVTYMLHIALRFELEQAIMNDEIKPEDVPGEWDSRFEKYFGIKVDKPSNGWLQDVHWSYGLMGYFPTYLLGNLAAGQNWNKFTKLNPAWESHFRAGNFTHLQEFMTNRLYKIGYVKSLDDAMVDSTSELLNPQHWIDYADNKFSKLYKLVS